MNTSFNDDKNVDFSMLQTKRLAFIGYGNQGAAQSQNLRDSGISEIVIGNRDDEYRATAIAHGFQVISIFEAAAWGDVVFLLIPDEIQPRVFREQIAPNLKIGATLVEIHPLLWNPETCGLTHSLFIHNRADIVE